MDKRWYPVAFTAAMVGCGGDVDKGGPAATGGSPAAFYGVALVSGGSTGIDTGKPAETGGRPASFYGIRLPTGGTSSVDTGNPAQTGGTTPVPPYGVIPN